MSKLVWDQSGERFYETGTKNVALYVMSSVAGKYENGVVWNGVTAITESPSGAEESPLYADDIKYLSLRSAEEFGATIEAYTYPDEWMLCDGSVALYDGVVAGQQKRKPFGLAYKSIVGNDSQLDDYGYKLHIIYNATASPSERAYQTVNDSPEAITFSWEVTTTPVAVTAKNSDGSTLKPLSIITIDSNKVDATKLQSLEDTLFGTSSKEATLPTPDEVFAFFADTNSSVTA